MILDMTLFITLVSLLQSLSISLGVGSSTLAVSNFFVAIYDGTIDEAERRMMGVVYVVLRVAMVLILLTTILLISHEYSAVGLLNLSAFSFGQLLALFVLYINALLMTAHLMPTTVGPAFQAGSWYTLGTLAGLKSLGLVNFTFTQFFLGYISAIIFMIGLINAIMAIIKNKRLAK